MTEPAARKVLKYVALFILAAIAMQLLSRFLIEKDSALPGAESFLRSSSEIRQELGKIKSSSVTRSIRSPGSPGKERLYREWTFSVTGEKSGGRVIVRAEEPIGEKYSYQVVSIE